MDREIEWVEKKNKKHMFTATILFGTGNLELLDRAVFSLIPQVAKASEKKIVVLILNKTNVLIDKTKYPFHERIHIEQVSQDILYPQILNQAIRQSIASKDDFMFQFHDDAMALPGLIEGMIEKYEEVAGTQWSAIFGGAGDHCSFYNHKYNSELDVWYDPFLFPHYFMDNHYFRVATLKGWPIIDVTPKRTIHEGSAGLNIGNFRKKNGVAFPFSAGLYRAIWGGDPGKETVTDPTAMGVV